MPSYFDTTSPLAGQDITGLTSGRLTVIRFYGVKYFSCGAKGSYWLCKCNCGQETIKLGNKIKAGSTTSCGCYRDERARDAKIKHGKTKHHLFGRWSDMHKRCSNPNCAAWKHYGGRGIKVCERWNEFQNFLDDMEETFNPALTLDRKNNDEGYCKENCRWATNSEQVNNRRPIAPLTTFNGKSMTMVDWSRALGGTDTMVFNRFKNGWSLERALTTQNTKCKTSR